MIRSDNFTSGIREKSNIAITIFEKLLFLKGKKKIFYFDGSNNIFVDCIVLTTYIKY